MNRECGFGALTHLPFTGLLNWESGQQIRFSFPETSTNPRTGETAQRGGEELPRRAEKPEQRACLLRQDCFESSLNKGRVHSASSAGVQD